MEVFSHKHIPQKFVGQFTILGTIVYQDQGQITIYQEQIKGQVWTYIRSICHEQSGSVQRLISKGGSSTISDIGVATTGFWPVDGPAPFFRLLHRVPSIIFLFPSPFLKPCIHPWPGSLSATMRTYPTAFDVAVEVRCPPSPYSSPLVIVHVTNGQNTKTFPPFPLGDACLW
jgi:hypothetical protein